MHEAFRAVFGAARAAFGAIKILVKSIRRPLHKTKIKKEKGYANSILSHSREHSRATHLTLLIFANILRGGFSTKATLICHILKQ